jgi:primosomal protein N' (replication factor Y)
MTIYLEIAVNVPQASGLFHYHLPPELEGRVGPGSLVVIPFGAQTVQGIVLRRVDQPAVPQTRPVLELVDPLAVLTAGQMRLAGWLSVHTLAPLAACVALMLPSGLGQRADVLYSALPGASSTQSDGLSPAQSELLALLRRRGELRGRQIDAALPHKNWRPAAQSLSRRGLIHSQSVLPPPAVRPKMIRTAQLAASPEMMEAAFPKLSRNEAALARRQAILRFLLREPMPVDVAWVYAETGGNLEDLKKLDELGLVLLRESEVWRDPLDQLQKEIPPSQPLDLTPDQQKAWEQVRAEMSADRKKPLLLHGVTGSGKTEIYLRAVAETLRLGRQAIVLVPEIALTPQTVRRFVARFPGQVGLVHSRLSPGENYDTWRRARAGLLPVIVGPRSALFAPLDNLGLIVVDECHDESYYQGETPPYYHAVETAASYADLTGAVCLMGSATPNITDSYQARAGQWRLLRLPQRVPAHRAAAAAGLATAGEIPAEQTAPVEAPELPPVQVVDMRAELKSGNRSIFSRRLHDALAETLAAGQQAILFLNRRGSATYVFCRECGASVRCPRCDLPLSAHAGGSQLICHHCGYQRLPPKRCPQCGSTAIRQYGTGTEKVEAEVNALFPGARTLRWDAETTRQKGAHEIILAHFAGHRADVLVGTQMLAKGLDLPLVTLVGVVLADVGLNLPDYRAGERAFQVLTQVAGRAGRSPLGGQVVLQTFQPEHYIIQAAAQHDYEGFYRQELEYRRRLGYPPFYRLARLEYRHSESSRARAAAQGLARQIQHWIDAGERRATQIIGPAPCFFSRLGGLYRWQIILRSPDPAGLLAERNLAGWRIEFDPPNLL